MSNLRQALIQAAHLIADAIESDNGGAPESVKKPVPPKKRRQNRAPYRPINAPNDIDVARVKAIARKAGIYLP